MPAGRLLVSGAEGMSRFLADVPTAHADYELRQLREQASSTAWNANDLRDVTALAPAIVYADVVVTENQWKDFAHRAGLAKRHGTKVVSDLNSLTDTLIRQGAAA